MTCAKIIFFFFHQLTIAWINLLKAQEALNEMLCFK